MRQLIKLTGLSDLVYDFGTFISYFISTFMFAILFVTVSISEVHPSLTSLVFIALFTSSSIIFSLTISILFNDVTHSVIILLIIWTLGPLCDIAINFLEINISTPSSILLYLVLPPTYQIHIYFDAQSNDNLSPIILLLLTILSIAWWSVMNWYLKTVWPFQDGLPKPFYFFCTQEYWKSSTVESNDDFNPKEVNAQYFETVDPRLVGGIQIQRISKSFGNRLVVKNVDLNVYRGEITVLLGHNGAGKTTTMNIITGMFPSSSGRILINGFDLKKTPTFAMNNMGFCPQQNVLFESMTTHENITIFAMLRGVDSTKIKDEVNKVLGDVKLASDIEGSKLSGGMKRRLQIGMALVGGSNILILDEPSSGLDVEARKEVWEILTELKMKGSLILMTTHHMEEADHLADRIAIMSHGEIKCYGSSKFLKKAFRVGHHLRIEKGINFKRELFETYLRTHFRFKNEITDTGSEVKYSIENSEDDTGLKLSRFCEHLMLIKDDFFIRSCGVNSANLDDVFFQAGVIFDGQADPTKIKIENFKYVPLDLHINLRSQLKGLFIKRCDHLKRSYLIAIFYFSLNYIAVGICLMLANTKKNQTIDSLKSLNLTAINTIKKTIKRSNKQMDFEDIYIYALYATLFIGFQFASCSPGLLPIQEKVVQVS